MDGNGRTGRFVMNVMLASAGYSWTIIPRERRDEYLMALEAASVDRDARLFAELLGHLLRRGLKH
jgi:Fic family protein